MIFFPTEQSKLSHRSFLELWTLVFPNFRMFGGISWMGIGRDLRARKPIPILETRAALWCPKHLVRSSKWHGHRLLMIVDAMAVALLYS